MPSHENPTDARPPRRRLRRRVAILALPLTAVAAVLLVYRHYTSPQRVCALAERYLQRYVNGDVTISRASFSWLDGIRLIDVAIGEARAAGRTDSQNKDPARSPVAD
ncbi:MAG: hypothetical protein ACE5EX_03490, partial [Phycisphaerae bacterium]